MSDIVYSLTQELRLDTTLAVTLGGGVVNLGKRMRVAEGDTVVLVYGEHVLGAAPVVEVAARTKSTLVVAHGRVRPLDQGQRGRLDAITSNGKVGARGGAYLP